MALIVDYLFCSAEAHRRQQLMSVVPMAQPIAESAKSSQSVNPTNSHKDDEDDFDHDELNQYLNEVLDDDEDNDEPNINTSISLITEPASSSSSSVPATSLPSNPTPTLSFLPSTAANIPLISIESSAKSSTPPPVLDCDDDTAPPASGHIEQVNVVTSNEPIKLESPAASPSSPVSTTTTSTVDTPVSTSSPIPTSLPQSTSIPPPPSSSPTSSKPTPAVRSPLDENDDEDLAELESMLQEVETGGVIQMSEEEEGDIDEQLAELENELELN